ncbi:MAG TPA: MaoC family dehydratase [Vineibacter sp.]|nr:MaoC family dehydratase [Vineibacter sp.]
MEMTFAALAQRVGATIGVSPWILIDQDRIDRFAAVTGDHGFIHVDPVAAAATPFGTTIAHGLLVLSLTGLMAQQALPAISDRAFLMNYGYDKVRMIAPVPCGTEVRGHFRLDRVSTRAEKQRLMHYTVTIERAGSDRPVLVADWLLMVVVT